MVMKDNNKTYDYIIVGAGSAGCVLANRLSASGQYEVLLLEAGGSDTKKKEVSIPVAFSKLFKTEADWDYQTEAQKHAGDRNWYWPRGKMLGGCSSMNAMVYQRGHPSNFQQWQEAAGNKNNEWGWDDVLTYYKKAENQECGSSSSLGKGGPLNVSDLRSPNKLTSVFIKAAKQAGYQRNEDFNDGSQEGFGFFQVTQSRGQRDSTATAYLRPVLKRKNLTVMTDVFVTKVLFDGTRATGITFVHNGNSSEVHLKEEHSDGSCGEVILSAGTVNSPHILMLSGIGDAQHLTKIGIEKVVADLPGVGRNLQDHIALPVCWYCTEPISLQRAESPRHLLNYLVRRRGPLTSSAGEGGGFVKLFEKSAAPELQYHFGPVFFIRHGFDNPEKDGFTIAPTLVDVKSRGYIQLKSTDPMEHPLIQPNYLQDERDVTVLVEGVKLARKIAKQMVFDRYRGDELLPGADIQSDEEIKEFVREKAETIYHPVGTCKMGVDPATTMAVVDPELKVYGVSGLRVVDASIMPTIVNANTNGPTIMIAEKAADMILRRRL